MAHDVDRFAAFRAWRAERPAGTRPLDAFGSTWEVPARMPAELWLWMAEQKAAGKSEDTMSDEDALELLRITVPADVLAQWREFDLSVHELVEPVQRLIGIYLSGDKGGDGSGEPPAAETPPPTPPMPPGSSNAGPTSRLTFNGSTESTSPPRSET